MPTNPASELVDREAASAIYRHFGFNGGTALREDNPVLQIILRHRLSAIEGMRELDRKNE